MSRYNRTNPIKIITWQPKNVEKVSFVMWRLININNISTLNICGSYETEKQHGLTRQCYLQLNTTDNDKRTRILTKLQHKYTCLPEKPYTALYSWWWVELSPETCRVKPLRRINAIVASCSIYFTIKHDARNHKYYVTVTLRSILPHQHVTVTFTFHSAPSTRYCNIYVP